MLGKRIPPFAGFKNSITFHSPGTHNKTLSSRFNQREVDTLKGYTVPEEKAFNSSNRVNSGSRKLHVKFTSEFSILIKGRSINWVKCKLDNVHTHAES